MIVLRNTSLFLKVVEVKLVDHGVLGFFLIRALSRHFRGPCFLPSVLTRLFSCAVSLIVSLKKNKDTTPYKAFCF